MSMIYCSSSPPLLFTTATHRFHSSSPPLIYCSPPMLIFAAAHPLRRCSSSPPLFTTHRLRRSSPTPLGREEFPIHLTSGLRVTGSELMDDSRTPLSTALTNRRAQLPEFSGEGVSSTDLTQRKKSSQILSITVQNRCCMFLRMKNSLTVKRPPSKRQETSTSSTMETRNLSILPIPHVIVIILRLANGNHQMPHLPITGQSPTVRSSAATSQRERLGQTRDPFCELGQLMAWKLKKLS